MIVLSIITCLLAIGFTIYQFEVNYVIPNIDRLAYVVVTI